MHMHSVWKSLKMSHFQKPAKLTVFGIFTELLSIQNVNVARFARNVECDFFVIFKHCAFLPKDKSPGCHGGLFANHGNQESGDGHNAALRHSPRWLDDDKILVGDVRWTVSSHIRSHVGHHVAKTVEATHGKLQKKSAQKWKDAENGDFGAGDRGCQCKCHL